MGVVRRGRARGMGCSAGRAALRIPPTEGMLGPPRSFPAQEGSVSPSPTEEELGESFCQLQRGYLLRALSY